MNMSETVFNAVLQVIDVHDPFLTCSVKSFTNWSLCGLLEGISAPRGDYDSVVRISFTGANLHKEIFSSLLLDSLIRSYCGLQLVS